MTSKRELLYREVYNHLRLNTLIKLKSLQRFRTVDVIGYKFVKNVEWGLPRKVITLHTITRRVIFIEN